MKPRVAIEMAPAEAVRAIPRRSRLTGFRCTNCGALFVTKRAICPECHKTVFKELPLSGKGTIWTFTLVKQPIVPCEWMGSYGVAVVQLKEGVKAVGQLVDFDDGDVKIGMEVEAVPRLIRHEPPGMLLHMYKFKPVRKKK